MAEDKQQTDTGEPAEKGGSGSLLDQAPDAPEKSEGGKQQANGVDPEHPEHPEWFLHNKYKTVEDQAKAYPELAKKLGAFTGAPEEYELKLPEGFEGEFNRDDPLLKGFQDYAREAGINQDGFDRILKLYIENTVGAEERSLQSEMAALGDRAVDRIRAIKTWGQANLTAEEYEAMAGMATTAGAVMVLERLIAKSRESRLGDESTAKPAARLTADELRDMRYAKNADGQLKMQVDPDYRKRIDKLYRDLYGEEPATKVV